MTQGVRGTKCEVLGRERKCQGSELEGREHVTPPESAAQAKRQASFIFSPDCINKIMMSHLTLHPKSEANYLCLYCLMTEALIGPLPPAGAETDLLQEAILC